MKENAPESNKTKTGFRSLLNRNFILILFISMAADFSRTMVNIPVNKFGVELGASAALIGAVATLYSLMTIFARPIGGIGLDRFNKKKWLLISLSVEGIAFIIYGFTNSLPVWIIARAIHGAGFALAGVTLSAVASLAVDKKALGSALGIYLSAPKLVGMIAPSVTMYIYGNYGPSGMFFTATVFRLISMLLILFLDLKNPVTVPSHQEKENKPKKSFSFSNIICPPAVLPGLINIFIALIIGCNMAFLVIYSESIGIMDVALFYTVTSFCSMFAKLLGGVIMDKYGPDKVVLPCLVLMTTGALMIAFAQNGLFLAAAGACISLGQGCSMTALQTLAMKSAPDKDRGIANSTFFLCADTGVAISGILAGALATWIGMKAMYIIFAMFPVLGVFIYLLILRPRLKAVESKTNV